MLRKIYFYIMKSESQSGNTAGSGLIEMCMNLCRSSQNFTSNVHQIGFFQGLVIHNLRHTLDL